MGLPKMKKKPEEDEEVGKYTAVRMPPVSTQYIHPDNNWLKY